MYVAHSEVKGVRKSADCIHAESSGTTVSFARASVVVDPSSASGIQDGNQCVRMKGSMYVRTVVEGEDTSDICVDTDSRLTAGDIPGL